LFRIKDNSAIIKVYICKTPFTGSSGEHRLVSDPETILYFEKLRWVEIILPSD
jgi:hypothetical protein